MYSFQTSLYVTENIYIYCHGYCSHYYVCCLNKFIVLYCIVMYESPLTITTGTRNYYIKRFDSEEDLIMEDSSGYCDQNRHKVS